MSSSCALHVVHDHHQVDLGAAELAAGQFLDALGISLDSESMRDTPGRMARAYAEAQIPFGGVGASGTGSRFGGAAANVDAFTETQWVTMRSEIPAYPF